ncbi:MAG: segregation/condensation protein A [bacterium]|nr:segregation/condensation protein A [bacterium]
MTDTRVDEARPNETGQAPSPGEQGDFIVDEATDEVLRLQLDMFEGPFEVLLYLIRSQEIDIFDIPAVKITEQYLRFLDLMRDESLEVTGDFLVMAATLIQIKSRMLLPAETDGEDEEDFEEEDPRLELVEKLLEYRKFRGITERLAELESERENWYTRRVTPKFEPAEEEEEELLEVTMYDLITAFRSVLRYISDDLVHTVEGEEHSIDEKIEVLQDRLMREGSVAWSDVFKGCRSRIELVCCFLAILELCRMGQARAHQHRTFEEIRLFQVAEGVTG